jgi:dTDP-4-dehydrorhamnose reductase
MQKHLLRACFCKLKVNGLTLRTMKILVTGAAGLVGNSTTEFCRRIGDTVVAVAREQLDIADKESVSSLLIREKPDSVINCAAWTDVDGCETNRGKNFAVNAAAVENLALGCRQVNANLVTISTDYVFDGAKNEFYTQRDDPNPQSEYAKAKLLGEYLAKNCLARAVIVRTGWIFGAGGKSFLSQMPQLLRAGKKIKVIKDSSGTPTFAPDLARRLRELAELDLPGIYHVTNAGEGTTFENFARSIAGVDQNLIEAVSFADLRRPAPRPQNSKLRCLISEKLGLQPLPHWEQSLQCFLENQLEN